VYHTIVRRILRQAFANVSTGDFEAVLAQCSPTIRHHFAGDHAFGGERNDVAMLRRWFRRVAAVLPRLRLDITDMFVKGMPWDTRAIVMWTEYADLPDGRRYVNHGIHHIQLRWGKVTSIRVNLDTQLAARVLEELGAAGITEAVAPPIIGASAAAARAAAGHTPAAPAPRSSSQP
jgi:ketosteroid isomerase-like protein